MRSRREAELPEGESYYISMTDMMVGVVFIFILLLSFFALQYRATTVALTKAGDPQTAALLAEAKTLQNRTIAAQVDYQNRVLCVPASALSQGDGGAGDERRCFAFSPPKDETAQPAHGASEARRSQFIALVSNDLQESDPSVHVDPANGALSFNADDLFTPNTDTLSPKGVQIAGDVARTLSERLPCYGYGAPLGQGCGDTPKMAAVNVAGNTSFNAFTPEGQQAMALALRRTVAFYKALTANQPVLGQIKDGPSPAAQPLLRVASSGQSSGASAASAAVQQSITIQFLMAQ